MLWWEEIIRIQEDEQNCEKKWVEGRERKSMERYPILTLSPRAFLKTLFPYKSSQKERLGEDKQGKWFRDFLRVVY